MAPYLEEVYLSSDRVLLEPGEPIREVYFPSSVTVSLVSIMSDGSTTEIGLVGNEGMVGLSVVLGSDRSPSRSIVQISGTALKLPARILKQQFQEGKSLQRLFLLYTQALLTQMSQSAACNRQHSIEKRLARWLLSVQDRVRSKDLPLTQESIANMLGTRRSAVTVAAGTLQKAGVIRYNRGKIIIVDRPSLEAAACECYSLIRNEYLRLLGSSQD